MNVKFSSTCLHTQKSRTQHELKRETNMVPRSLVGEARDLRTRLRENQYGAGVSSKKYWSSLFCFFFIVFIFFLSFLEGNIVTSFAIDRKVDVFVEIRHKHEDEHHKA